MAVDGRSGVGKSTLAEQLAARLDGTIVDGDGFFSGGVALRDDSPAARARACIDWATQRGVVEALREGRAATYHAFDWDAFDGRREASPTTVVPRATVLVEGVYSARSELTDLLDVRILVRVDDGVRLARLLAREGAIGPWERQWHEAEEWYFANAAGAFDVIVEG